MWTVEPNKPWRVDFNHNSVSIVRWLGLLHHSAINQTKVCEDWGLRKAKCKASWDLMRFYHTILSLGIHSQCFSHHLHFSRVMVYLSNMHVYSMRDMHIPSGSCVLKARFIYIYIYIYKWESEREKWRNRVTEYMYNRYNRHPRYVMYVYVYRYIFFLLSLHTIYIYIYIVRYSNFSNNNGIFLVSYLSIYLSIIVFVHILIYIIYIYIYI